MYSQYEILGRKGHREEDNAKRWPTALWDIHIHISEKEKKNRKIRKV